MTSPEIREHHEYVKWCYDQYLEGNSLTAFDIQKLKDSVSYVRENGGHFLKVYRGFFIEHDVPLLTKKPVIKL